MEIDQDLKKAEDADTAYMGTFNELTGGGGEPQAGLKLTTELDKDRAEFADAFNGMEPMPPAEATKPAAKKSFGATFREHLNKGDKVFEWNGKKYTTQLKGEVASRPRVARPAAQPMATSAPPILAPTEPKRSAIKPLLNQASPIGMPSSQTEKPSPSRRGLSEQHIRDRQDAYDQWQSARSANHTWYGGRAQPKPGMLEREQQAEKRFSELLSNPR